MMRPLSRLGYPCPRESSSEAPDVGLYFFALEWSAVRTSADRTWTMARYVDRS